MLNTTKTITHKRFLHFSPYFTLPPPQFMTLPFSPPRLYSQVLSFCLTAALTGWLLLTTACQPQADTQHQQTATTNNGDKARFYGVWTNQAFQQAVKNQKDPYNQYDCTEIYIDPSLPDSLWLIRCQMDVALLGYKFKANDSLFIAEWQQKGVTIALQPDQTLKLINHNDQTETLFTKAEDAYIEAEEMPPFKYAYRKFINAHTIAGTYIDPKKPTIGKVEFRTDGATKGLGGYNKYTLWVGGDYASMCQNNVLSLNNGAIDTLFGWQQNGDSLAFFTLKNKALPDEKPEYVYKDKALVLVKQH